MLVSIHQDGGYHNVTTEEMCLLVLSSLFGIIHGTLLLAVSHPGACDAPDS